MQKYADCVIFMNSKKKNAFYKHAAFKSEEKYVFYFCFNFQFYFISIYDYDFISIYDFIE